MLVIGLVGAIGAGKSEALRLLRDRGARPVAADELSREVLGPGQPALASVRAAFGDEYFTPDGQLLRRALGNLIFHDEAARRRLDDIVHPLMTDLLRRRLDSWREEGLAVAVVESAVLEEMGALPLVDVLVRVEAAPAVRLERLRARDGLSDAEARARLAAHERLRLDGAPAAFVLHNDGDVAQLGQQVEQLWGQVVCGLREQ